MASTWCSKGRQREVNGAAWGMGNAGTEAGRQPGGLG